MTDRRLAKLLPVERWPTRAEAEASRWFSPVRIGPHLLNERTWVPAMVPWRASDQGFVTPEVLGWYERFARGEPGAIVVEATGIRNVASGPLLRAGHDDYLEGLRHLVKTVKAASSGRTRLYIQLIDFLAIKRRPTREAFFGRYWKGDPALAQRLLGASEEEIAAALPPRELEAYRFGLRERITDTHLPHIAELPRVLPGLFADAARRCLDAGFDGVELHFAHAYTMASFLSGLNTRTDGYGGPREHRVRLPLEVIAAVRAQVGTRLALGCRFLADEIIAGGNRVDDACFFGVELARAGLDFLSLSRGGKFEDAKQPKVGHAAYPYTGPSGHECMPTTNAAPPGPWGRNLPAVAQVKRAVVGAGFSTPIVACGGIATFQQAEEVLARGDADVVASARQTLADPDWTRKVREGRGEEVRRCLFTNYCEGLDQAHEVVTCQRWDRLKGLADDATAPRTRDGRRLVAP
ncbi:MAG: NADH:flavin oxidoreductase [Archangiaceae bacterium]|nr:NADH:flavin oxidoreductase [Archangiaceae bacterium]